MDNKELMDQYNNAFLFMGKFIDEFVSTVDQQYQLSHNAWLILKLIRDNGQLTNRKIAQIMKVAPASTSIQLSPLLKRGLVNQSLSNEDRRVRQLTLSDDGLRIVNELEKRHLARFDQWANALGHDETLELLRLIKKVETDVLPNDKLVNGDHLR
ncbi:MarR family winged helix-turn-helix transcriptional regulator [Furfurilactobacillus sp. WILCCON 0119]